MPYLLDALLLCYIKMDRPKTVVRVYSELNRYGLIGNPFKPIPGRVIPFMPLIVDHMICDKMVSRLMILKKSDQLLIRL
jgi:hypothetical protein